MSAIKLAIAYGQHRIEASAIERVTADLRIDLYRHILSLSPGSLRNQANGDLLTRLLSDVTQIEYLIFSGPLGILNNIFRICVFGFALFLLSWQLTVCALIIGPLVAAVSLKTTPNIRRASRVARRKVSDCVSFAEERLSAVPLVQTFGALDIETEAFTRYCRNVRASELKVVKVQALSSLLTECIAALGGIAVILVGVFAIGQGSLTVGTLIAFLGSVGSLVSPLREIAKAPGRFQRATVKIQRVVDIFDTVSLVTEKPTAKPLQACAGKMEFRNLSFGYTRGQPVLQDINLTIEPDETVAIVGPSGSGKSTLVKLALRLYDPSAGAILIDDKDVRDVTLDSLRRAVSVVFQEPYVFSGSIAGNICYGAEQRSEPQLHAAAKAAHVSNFSSQLPAGYDSAVGPRGGWISGGQRQRIALARALMRDARILVFDEATASLDSETEELIRSAMVRLIGRRTTLIVGHRLSSVRKADRVIVLDGGRIVEIGTPSSLLRPGTRYYNLFAAQAAITKASA